MPNLTTVVVLALANWRISSLVTDTSQAGPFDILHAIRHWIGVRFDEHSAPHGTTWAARGALCLWCLSVWVGVGEVVLYTLWPLFTWILFAPFALSAGAIVIDYVIRKLSVGS